MNSICLPPNSEARLAQYRVWLKPSGEQHFVYGNHVVKVPRGFLRFTGSRARVGVSQNATVEHFDSDQINRSLVV